MLSSKHATACAAAIVATLGMAAANASDEPQGPLAKLAALSGDVLVDQGQSLAPAETGMTLSPLDRVMVLDESRATLSFSDGCSEQVVGPAVRVISREHTCQQSSATSLDQVTASAAASTDVLALERAATAQGDDEYDQLGLIILGVVSATGLGVALAQDDPDRNTTGQLTAQTPTDPPDDLSAE